MDQQHSQTTPLAPVTPVQGRLQQAKLDAIHDRVRRDRWSGVRRPAGADEGRSRPHADFMRLFCDCWTTADNRLQQASSMNLTAHVVAPADGHHIHILHKRGSGTALPRMLNIRSWPCSSNRCTCPIDRLAHPEQSGVDVANTFSIVIPLSSATAFAVAQPQRGDSARSPGCSTS
jgi:Epoxide hydrolase N terminus